MMPPPSNLKIAIGGPPHSGKSVLRQRLKDAIAATGAGIYPYVLSTNPDGEGAWFQEAYHNDPEAAAQYKREAKRKWTEEHAGMYAGWVANSSVPLTFVDLGGIIDDKNRQICGAATHAILLAPDEAALAPWRGFCEECNLVVMAELISDYHAVEDRLPPPASPSPLPFRATIHRLERGEIHTPRPAVDELARVILRLLRNRRTTDAGAGGFS